jgi:predicted phage terminase large subunit-like protein
VGGQGAGKSRIGAYDLLRRAVSGRLYLVTAPTYKILRDATCRTFSEVAAYCGQLVRPIQGEAFSCLVRAPMGGQAEVLFRSTEDPEHLRGPNLSGLWMDEASLSPHAAYQIGLARLREASETGWLTATFTPKGRTHWTYDIFARQHAHTLISARTADNPFLPETFLQQVHGAYTGLLAEQELGGQFVTVEGAEWPAAYFPDSLWFDDLPEGLLARAIALDPSKGRDAKSGDYAAFALAAVDVEGTIWVEADLVRGRSAEWLAEQAVEHQRRFQADVFGVESNQWLQLFANIIDITSRRRQVFLPIVELYNQVPKLVRIRRLGPYLAQGRFRFRNTPGTRLLVDQLREFPEGAHDDAPDSLEMALRLLSDLLAGREDEEQEGTVLRT